MSYAERLRRQIAAARPGWLTHEVLLAVRLLAVAVWAFFFARQCYLYGVPFDRTGLLVWICSGLVAATIGSMSMFYVIIDFAPFAAVLIAYDYLRGLSEGLGMPTWWHPQVDVDKFLFLGHEPTVWLQEHLRHEYPDVRWYDVAVTICYCSFFFLPYVTAGVLWLRRRADFYRWSLRFVSLSFLGFALFALIPAAPPWAAARCAAVQVADHPNNPYCMYLDGSQVPNGGLLGPFTTHLPGANPWVERNSTWGFADLHLSVAKSLLDEGQGAADAVAAVPSLHLGGTVLFVLFMWPRVHRFWRPVLVAYPLAMTFSLTYSAEHFVADCIAGALLAVLVHLAANRIERWRNGRRGADTLGGPQPDPTQESSCPPSPPLPETTPSST